MPVYLSGQEASVEVGIEYLFHAHKEHEMYEKLVAGLEKNGWAVVDGDASCMARFERVKAVFEKRGLKVWIFDEGNEKDITFSVIDPDRCFYRIVEDDDKETMDYYLVRHSWREDPYKWIATDVKYYQYGDDEYDVDWAQWNLLVKPK